MVRGKPATRIQTGRRSTASTGKSIGTPTPLNPAPNTTKAAKPFVATGCTKCGIIITEDTKALQCDRCVADKWMCAQCLNLPGDMYDHLVSDPNCPLCWFCNECEKKNVVDDSSEFRVWNSKMDIMFDKMDQILNRVNCVENQLNLKADLQMVNKIEERLQKIENQVQDTVKVMDQQTANKLEGHLSLMQQRLQSVEREVQEVQISKKLENTQVMDYVEKVISTRTQDSVDEEAEKKKRKKNLVMYKVAEAGDDNAADRNVTDLAFVTELLDSVFKIHPEHCRIARVFRLGRWDSSKDIPRPLLVEFNDLEAKERVMSSLKYLRDAGPPFKGISVAHDLTPAQRDEIKKLVEQARQEHVSCSTEPTENFWFRVVGKGSKPRVIKVRKQQQAASAQ